MKVLPQGIKAHEFGCKRPFRLYIKAFSRYNNMSGYAPANYRNGGESMRQLDKLWEYQQADKKAVDYETEIRQYPQRLQLLKLRNIVADQQTVVRGMENDANKALARLEELGAQRDKASQTFTEIKASVEGDSFETAAQVKKAISQMTDAEAKLKNAEKELTKMVSHSQMMENRYKEVRLKAAKARDEYTKLKVGYDKEYEKQSAKLAVLRSERTAAQEAVSPQFMERYEAVRSQCFPAVAKLNNDQCSGCNMSLPSAVAKQLQGNDEIVECENCGRILYMD